MLGSSGQRTITVPDIYVGFGSNIEPERHLREAIRDLGEAFGPLTTSSVYRNPPVGFSGADFLNLVLRLASERTPQEIEAVLAGLESAAGRVRSAAEPSSRALDLDMLLYGSLVDPDHNLPRADIRRYAFVLAPLAEIAPQLVHPLTGERFAAAWSVMALGKPPLRNLGPLDQFLERGSQN